MVRAASLLVVLASLARPAAQKLVESVHVAGPSGLEGWTESAVIEEVKEQGPLPITLVVARHGKVVRRIDGSPFVWGWRFQPDGRRVAYETGPLHFSMTCVLRDIQTGKELDSVDCYRPPEHMPKWAEELERQEQR